MEASIIANGTVKSGAWLRKNLRGTIIAADGGANTCLKHRITPDYVIGDFDSIRKSTLTRLKKTSRIIRAPDQNKTDLQKALALAHKLKAERVFVFGAIGTELDHTLGNLLSLDTHCVMRDETHDIHIVEKNLKLQGKPGELVSVIALSLVRGLSYTGLKWQAPKRILPPGWLGTRNRFTGTKASIRLTSGKVAVLCIKT